MFISFGLVICFVVACFAQLNDFGSGGSSFSLFGQGNDHHHGHHIDYYAHPKYKFKYGVSDDHTHDHHSQQESRDGDVVQGEYSLHEPDGTIRIVKYTADHKNGFNAEVIRKGHAKHPETHVKHAFLAFTHHNHDSNYF